MTPSNGHIKHFVLDTNVLLHNPNALFMFADNEVIIPFDVIEELDTFKTNSDDLGRNARTVIRHLDSLRLQGKLSEGVKIPQTGGRIRVILEQDQKLCPGLTANTPDNRIICCAFALKQEGNRVVFITKDINARIKSDAMGLVAEDFEAQKVDFERLYTGWREMTVPAGTIDKLFAEKQISLDLENAYANEFILMKDEQDASHTAIARLRADGLLIPVRGRRGPVFGIAPRNLQQTMALDLLMDDSVKLVSLIGAAGTGKTLLALAAGLAKTLNEEVYQKMLCARPIMPL
ncbi:MAG TPA: PIN domain-containing protein, partial [Tepidisphaeraceae bacterium]